MGCIQNLFGLFRYKMKTSAVKSCPTQWVLLQNGRRPADVSFSLGKCFATKISLCGVQDVSS